MLNDYVAELAKYKKLGQETLEQLSDEDLNYFPSPDTNSIAVIICHLHGNLLSRFTDLLTTDGEKPWRNRAAEFASKDYLRVEIVALWEAGWRQLESALNMLSDEELSRPVTIKGQLSTVDRALSRTLAHVAYHVGQIVLLGRMRKGEQWQYLSTPR